MYCTTLYQVSTLSLLPEDGGRLVKYLGENNIF